MSEYVDPSEVMMPLVGEVKRAKFAVIDLETKDGDTQKAGFTRPFLAGLFDGETYLEFRGPNCCVDLLAVVLSPRFDGWTFYAHNGGGFDWLHLLHLIRAAEFRFDILSVGSTIQMLTVKPPTKAKRKGWKFLDSYKLIPLKLADACRTFGGLEKLEQDLDAHESDPSWSTYLERDCRGLYDVLVRFHDLVEIRLSGEVGITAASTSMKTFRRAYQRDYLHRHEEHHAFFREGYYGGRVEIFRESASCLRYYDINSSYPHSMLAPLPVGEKTVWQGTPTRQLRKGKVGFARALVDYPRDVLIPALPYRDDKTGRLIFPVGRFGGVWSAIELDRAIEQGAKVTWLESVWIEARPVLAPMVRDLYAYRDKSRPDYDEGLALTAKLLLNSLYGKFGMNTEKERLVCLAPGEMPPLPSRPAAPRDPNCSVFWVEEKAVAPYIIPQIAAQITALSRLKLHSGLLQASARGSVAYCDTDSILTTAELDTSTELGGWKDEGKGELFEGEFLLPKLYALKGDRGSLKFGMKGFSQPREGAAKLKLYETLKRGETVSIERLDKVGALAAAGFTSGPQLRPITKQIRSRDEKRTYLENGHTLPLVIDEW